MRDFKRLYPNHENCMSLCWPTVKDQLIETFKKCSKTKSVEDKSYVHLLPTLSTCK